MSMGYPSHTAGEEQNHHISTGCIFIPLSTFITLPVAILYIIITPGYMYIPNLMLLSVYNCKYASLYFCFTDFFKVRAHVV